MRSQVNSFLDYGDGIHSSSSSSANSTRCSSKRVMSIEWAQTIIFILTPFVFMLLLIDTEEDDDDGPGGGLMTPVYSPSPSS